MSTQVIRLPRPFIWRRLHSLLGLWIVLFLIEHLITNSQAALLIGHNGEGFIRAVNFIKNLPYLSIIEIVLLGVPILFHAVWGIRYLFTAKLNSLPSDGARPALTRYSRNHAYSWQRITSWILLVGIIAHVAFMRFYMYPVSVQTGKDVAFFVRISMDPGLYTVSERLGVILYDKETIQGMQEHIESQTASLGEIEHEAHNVQASPPPYIYKKQIAELMARYQFLEDQQAYLKGLEKRSLSENQVIAEAPDFGTATLLIVRDSFKSIFKAILYTIFVLAAVFHAFNGLWTFMITWGLVLKMRSQSQAVNWCTGIMVLIGFLGIAAVWGTYFLNLRS